MSKHITQSSASLAMVLELSISESEPKVPRIGEGQLLTVIDQNRQFRVWLIADFRFDFDSNFFNFF